MIRRAGIAFLGIGGCGPEIVEGVPVAFGFPVAEADQILPLVIGFDHDPDEQEGALGGSAVCVDYDGRSFPFCYDDHSGSDFVLEGGFDAMDAGSATVVAAAAGVVVETQDGNYDRCRLVGIEVSCDGYEKRANYVIVEHPDGMQTWYWHLATDSVAVTVGQSVACGDPLGRIGSSGQSSMPHLHFGVVSATGEDLDPYAGAFSRATSLWEDQGQTGGLPEAGCTQR